MNEEARELAMVEIEGQLERREAKIRALENHARRAKRLIRRDLVAIESRAADALDERKKIPPSHPLWLELTTEHSALDFAATLLRISLSRVAFTPERDPLYDPEPE